MLDCLHEAGIEIVSPTFMNQRPLPPDQVIIPKMPVKDTKPPPVSTSDAPENVIFDKANEADRIENLKDHREQLLTRVKELEASLDKLEGSEKTQAEQEIEAGNARLKGLDVILNSKKE